ncbi:Asp/Glu/hydantoin racemase [Bacillus sp. FJAT-49711]|uniref:aspartate/glutamate racemase family protein n=1 Tax=Bacillus sp. FJAT-49711 TaxID=2833585 RepID=UPI001BC9D63D|nr:aspartate/glutamate racemase family protein [Bacillus sp. FJAT-49711]MBS4220892.1 Asp/Glu/hydantoin racemase [Bacillus sp. FJAT-49711]
MSKTLAIIHTTPVTVGPLKQLANEVLSEISIMNFMDDSILPQLAQNGGNLNDVKERWIQYAQIAEQMGADIILNACSSVGELVDIAGKVVKVPIVRIDKAMAEEAIKRGTKIGVIATLSTTMNPTLNLLKATAKKREKKVDFLPDLVEEAYKLLISGDQKGHDDLLVEHMSNLSERSDIVVLAQASMARAVPLLAKKQQRKFLTSPKFGIMSVKQILEE